MADYWRHDDPNDEDETDSEDSSDSEPELNEDFVYHYTTKENLKKIIKSGRIKPSTDTRRDANLGKGVYFTSKDPDNSDEELMENNYGPNPRGIGPERTEAYIAIPADEIDDELETYPIPDRDVHVYLSEEKGLKLKHYNWEYGKRT